MSRFYVGQRVRAVGMWDGPGPSPTGMEGVITDKGQRLLSLSTGRLYDWLVRLSDGTDILADSHELEPITDSYDKTTWDQCVWMPEHLRVGA